MQVELDSKRIKVIEVYDSIAISSGISSVIVGWLKNINRTYNIDMDFLCCWHREPSYEEEIIKHNSRIFYLEKNDKICNYFTFNVQVKKFFEEHAREYDIIHLHSSIFSYPIMYYARKYGIKIRIIHVHSAAKGNTRISSIRNSLITVPMSYLCTHYWACSEEAAQVWFKNKKIKSYSVILNGINTLDFSMDKKARDSYRNKWNISTNEFLIGHISNMTPIKNVPFIIEMLNELVKKKYQIKLVLIGKDELPTSITKKIEEYGLQDIVINEGVNRNIKECIHAIDACVMPSTLEGYGLVPLEAQAAHIPVVVSTGFPKIVCPTQISIRLPLEVERWVNTIEQLINQNGMHGYIVNLDDYDIKNTSNTVAEYYRKYYNTLIGERYEN